MPVYEVEETGNKELVFGTGDISISAGWLQEHPEVGMIDFQQQEKREIGEFMKHEPNLVVHSKDVPVRMVFEKVESVDVLIERLEKVKEYMNR